MSKYVAAAAFNVVPCVPLKQVEILSKSSAGEFWAAQVLAALAALAELASWHAKKSTLAPTV